MVAVISDVAVAGAAVLSTVVVARVLLLKLDDDPAVYLGGDVEGVNPGHLRAVKELIFLATGRPCLLSPR